MEKNDQVTVQRVYYLAIEGRSGQLESISQFGDGEFTIGRSPDCTLVLPSPEVSRLHAKIIAKNGLLSIADLGSKGGTYVNGTQVNGSINLALDAKVYIGSYRIHFDTRVEPLRSGDLTIRNLDLGSITEPVDIQKQPATMAGDVHELRTSILVRSAAAPVKQAPSEDDISHITISNWKSLISHSENLDSSDIVLEKVESDNPGDTLSKRYEIIRRLAEGAYGTIWLVQEKLSKRYAALKILKMEFLNDKEMVDQFMVESMITARLQHPNILPVYDLGFLEHNQLYYTMRLVEGAKTSKILADSANQRRAIYILVQVASAISYAHKQNLMHLDLKPANLLIDNNDHCYVTDWGLVRVIPGRTYSLEMPNVILPHLRMGGRSPNSFDRRSQSYKNGNDRVANTMTAMATYFGDKVAGTWRYMAPEQAGGKPGPASDLWALGLMLYEALTGIHPYQLLNLQQDDIFAIARLAPGSIPSVVSTAKRMNRRIIFPKVSTICDRALRMVELPTFPDVGSFADALREAIGFDPVQRSDASEEASRRRLSLISELATLPFYSIGRRKEIKEELYRLQLLETNHNNVAVRLLQRFESEPTIRR